MRLLLIFAFFFVACIASRCESVKSTFRSECCGAPSHETSTMVCPFDQHALPSLHPNDRAITTSGQQLFGVNSSTGAMPLTNEELMENVFAFAAAEIPDYNAEPYWTHQITSHIVVHDNIPGAEGTEVYVPTTNRSHPVVLYIHGVGSAFTAEMYRNNGKIYAEVMDAVVVHVNYTFMYDIVTKRPTVREHVDSLLSAARWVERELSSVVDPALLSMERGITCMGNAVGGFGCGHLYTAMPQFVKTMIFSWTFVDLLRTYSVTDKPSDVPMQDYMETTEFLQTVFEKVFPAYSQDAAFADPWGTLSDQALRENCPRSFFLMPGYDFFTRAMMELATRFISLGCPTTIKYLPARQHGFDTYALDRPTLTYVRQSMRADLDYWNANEIV